MLETQTRPWWISPKTVWFPLMFRNPPAFGFLVVIAMATAVRGADSRAIDFNRDVRPILSDKCFQCHGPDEETLEAGLRLDVRASATGEGAIVPGDPSASELLARILSDDSSDVMPPRKVKKPVTKEEAAILERWISEGAEYAGHWSFEPISEVEPPAVVDPKNWAKNDIDHFVLSALQSENIEPSSEAEPSTLARRLSLDLLGLLPSPESVEAFVKAHADDPDAAVSRYVDDLLDSKHYGERWGRHWLDQARYSDSNGYTIDSERTMWPYRDWVIRAINDDVPFDQFTIEQIAGDLLPEPSKAQLVASGFHRNTLINQEGGTDDEQFRNEEVVDRVNTTGAVWLGLTLGCAQCHTHKFDPISQKEYFELFAFFNQGEDVNNTGPTLEVSEGELFLDDPDPEKLATLENAKAELASLERSQGKRQTAWEAQVLSERESDGPGASWERVKPLTMKADGGAPLERLKDDSILAGQGTPMETYRISLPPSQKRVAAIRLQLIPHESLPQNGPGRAGNGNIVLTRVEFYRGNSETGTPLAVVRVAHDHAQPGFSAANLIDGNPDTGWAINVGKGTPKGVKMNAEHEAHFVFAEPIETGAEGIEVVLRHEKNANYNIGRFAFDVSETAPHPVAEERLLTTLQVPADKRSADDKKFLAAEFVKADAEKRVAEARVTEAKRALGLGATVKTMVMRDRSERRETFIHRRGSFLDHDTETGPLAPGVPEVLPPLPEIDETKAVPDRLDLAHWLVRADHPLTPRVTVNRVWMRYFGKGFVETENDFGTQGAFPTHPRLLDWLAREFVENGWSMKHLHRMIVNSATYRQSSHARPDLEEIDPLNYQLARQNRVRVEAEIVRDAALSASGLLSPEIGGPGVMPPQPEGVYAFTQRKVSWVVADGPDRYRRALYTKFYRSAPYPLLTTFDSPDFQSVCTARVRSNTPLQSLTMANDQAMFELAQGLGARLMREVSGTDSVSNRERIRHAFLLGFARKPSEPEVEAVATFQEQQATAFQADQENAKLVAPPKEWPRDEFDIGAAASWTAVARALMNTDEFITRE